MKFFLALIGALLLLFSTNTPSSAASHPVINEIMYDPADDASNEWVELYNPSSSPISLSGLKIGDEEVKGGGEGMYSFPDGSEISGNGFIVIARKPSLFQAAFGFKPDFEFATTSSDDPDVVNLTKYLDWASGSFALNNTSDEVLILGGSDNILEQISYSSGAIETKGNTYARGSDGTWVEAEPTPGKANSSGVGATPTPSPTPTPTSSPKATSTPKPSPAPSPTPSPRATGISTTLSESEKKRREDLVLGVQEATPEATPSASPSTLSSGPKGSGRAVLSGGLALAGLALLGFAGYSFLRKGPSDTMELREEDS